MSKVSIIVPVYNVEQYLDRCVQSLVNQTYTDIEIILVDDGSPDSCPKMCDDWAGKDTRIRVIHKQNGGLSDARNAGIDVATGEYLTFIDSDDYVKDTYTEYLMSLFSHSETAKVTACNHYIIRGEKQTKNAEFEGVAVFDRKTAFENVLYHDRVDVSACMKIYHRSVFETLRYPVGRQYEDTYVFGDVLNMTEEFVYGGTPQYYYFQREESIVNGGFSQYRLEYIDAVERLVDAAKKYPDLTDGCIRRLSHARLSVFRYMENCDKQYFDLRKKLRRQILVTSKQVCSDPRTPKRDKVALLLLKLGIKSFFIAWRIYGRIR